MGSGPLPSLGFNCHVFVDFDGTIATEDTTDRILERFAEPAWQDIEEEWKSGAIGSRECMVRQIDLIRATPAEFDAELASVTVDPGFAGFVALCRSYGFPVTVVSDGLDRSVRTVLSAAGLSLPYFANHLEWTGGNRWRLTFPHASNTCSVLAGNCKCRFSDGEQDRLRLMIGDGRSDFCIAGRCDMVFSKSSLTRHCIAQKIPHLPFGDFCEAGELLANWVAGRTDGMSRTSAHRGDE